MGMEGDVERYDVPASNDETAKFRDALDNAQIEGTLGSWPAGFGSGRSYDDFVANFATYQEAVNAKLREDRTVGRIVEAMMVGVTERIDRGPVRAGGGPGMRVR